MYSQCIELSYADILIFIPNLFPVYILQVLYLKLAQIAFFQPLHENDLLM